MLKSHIKSVSALFIFSVLFLFSCKKETLYFDVNDNEIKIPIASLGRSSIFDLDEVPKLNSKSLIPVPLKNGVEHQIVTGLQTKLMELGFMEEDKATSYFGDSTEEAIKKLERQLHLPIDGICDYEIYDVIMSKDAPTYEVKLGEEGEDIKDLQQHLYELSYLLRENDVNGYFGLRTEAAVREMQKNNNLKQTGIVDLATLNFLNNENVKAYTITGKSDPEIIKTYQKRLRDLGYYFGVCDGHFGDDFRMAIKIYQQDNSQYADGYINPLTKFSLDSEYAKPFVLSVGTKNSNVKIIQDRLILLNYLEPSRANGYYGEFTAQAVALFQENNGLEMTGKIDGDTNIALNSETAIISEEGPVPFLKQTTIDLLKKQKNEEPVQNIGNVDDLLKVAMLKLGSKYIRGSRGPNTFDCSGFVFWCLNQVGVKIDYMTTYYWRYSNQFEKVEKFEDLIPGDLIVINGHMGIVAENETIYDCTSLYGKVVHRDLNDWWKERFIIGFRIFDGDGKTTENKVDNEI